MKFLKKLKNKRFLLILSLLPLLFGCQKKGEVTIGFLIHDFDSEKWEKTRDEFIQSGQKAGVTVLFDCAEGLENKQYEQAVALLKEGIDVLVITPVNNNTAAAIVREAQSYNVPVLAYDRMIKNCDLDYYISFDFEKAGMFMAQEAINKVPRGNYLLLWGDRFDENARFVANGQLQVLKPHVKSGAIKIVYQGFMEGWNAQEATQTVKRAQRLSGSTPQVILASNDGLAGGALKAIPTEKTLFLTGMDAEKAACQRIQEGKQTLTIHNSVQALAKKALDVAIKLAKKQKISEVTKSLFNGRKEVPSILIDPMVINKNNLSNIRE